MIDMIVSRLDMKSTISRLVRLMLNLPPVEKGVMELGSGIPGDGEVLAIKDETDTADGKKTWPDHSVSQSNRRID